MKHPILLPRQHHLATLVVRHAHSRVLHNSVKETLTEVRTKFWIIKGQSFVKRCIHHYVTCKRFEERPLVGPTPPPLPDFRVSQELPFTFTGVDFAGPLHVKFGSIASENKVWIRLYTCCVTRAVHLEVVPDLRTAAFLRCLKRFTAHRGRFESDNGKPLRLLQRRLRRQESPAPWWGGVFERMIRMTKEDLRES